MIKAGMAQEIEFAVFEPIALRQRCGGIAQGSEGTQLAVHIEQTRLIKAAVRPAHPAQGIER